MEIKQSQLRIAACFMALALFSGLASAKTHPSYLTPKYCTDLVDQFVSFDMRSFDKYVNQDFNPQYPGSIRITIDNLKKRASWLRECDDYLKDTAQSRVFFNDQLTTDILSAMDLLAKELQFVREGVEYPDETGANNPAPFIKERYDTLAKLVDEHHTRNLMKKQFR